MSYYTNLLEELPRRNLELLNRYFKKEKKEIEPYEVTLLISLAMPVFVISTEIIKKNDGKEHPSLYRKLNSSIKENPIFRGAIDNWFYEHTYKSFNEIDALLPSDSYTSSKDLIALSKLTQIRNALSHGGLKFIKGNKNDIDKILFVSEKLKNDNGKKNNDGYHLNLMSIDNFKTLLINWCEFLRNENVIDCLYILKNAA
jgi:hypothetical protein